MGIDLKGSFNIEAEKEETIYKEDNFEADIEKILTDVAESSKDDPTWGEEYLSTLGSLKSVDQKIDKLFENEEVDEVLGNFYELEEAITTPREGMDKYSVEREIEVKSSDDHTLHSEYAYRVSNNPNDYDPEIVKQASDYLKFKSNEEKITSFADQDIFKSIIDNSNSFEDYVKEDYETKVGEYLERRMVYFGEEGIVDNPELLNYAESMGWFERSFAGADIREGLGNLTSEGKPKSPFGYEEDVRGGIETGRNIYEPTFTLTENAKHHIDWNEDVSLEEFRKNVKTLQGLFDEKIEIMDSIETLKEFSK